MVSCKGYKQEKCVDYEEVFAPVRLILAIAVYHDWQVHQMDVKLAFLNGAEDKVYRLNKALDGLKQAPRVWNTRLDNYLQNSGFCKCPYEYATYIKKNKNKKGDILIICVYVDDLLITGCSKEVINDFKSIMIKEFEMTDSGLMLYFLGIEPIYENPMESHWQVAKRILRYVKGTICHGLYYTKSKELKLLGYTDSDWAGDQDERKSTTGPSGKVMVIIDRTQCVAHWTCANCEFLLSGTGPWLGETGPPGDSIAAALGQPVPHWKRPVPERVSCVKGPRDRSLAGETDPRARPREERPVPERRNFGAGRETGPMSGRPVPQSENCPVRALHRMQS
uniref:Reverse transcriptase Ty1/copia-type domain-containing protein n=1 Tax=Ananas comosus var. bracteatus TaxID=296719 RepID=A0A6V7P1S9_ANACO|nr:unnamed protein product [Ananas comosus var. bracteatus]